MPVTENLPQIKIQDIVLPSEDTSDDFDFDDFLTMERREKINQHLEFMRNYKDTDVAFLSSMKIMGMLTELNEYETAAFSKRARNYPAHLVGALLDGNAIEVMRLASLGHKIRRDSQFMESRLELFDITQSPIERIYDIALFKSLGILNPNQLEDTKFIEEYDFDPLDKVYSNHEAMAFRLAGGKIKNKKYWENGLKIMINGFGSNTGVRFTETLAILGIIMADNVDIVNGEIILSNNNPFKEETLAIPELRLF